MDTDDVRQRLRAYRTAVYQFLHRDQNETLLSAFERIARAYTITFETVQLCSDETARRVLFCRYCERLSSAQTAEKLYYCERHVRRLQRKGILDICGKDVRFQNK